MEHIIVLGMAHSGTTILTRILSQHKDVDLYISGGESWLYENDALAIGDINPIIEFSKESTKQFILMKRPWVDHRKEFLLQNLPDAHYIYMQKEKEAIFESWSKPTSMVDEAARNDRGIQEGKYDHSMQCSIELEKSVKSFLRIQHEELCKNPREIFNQIEEKIGLDHFEFNLSEIIEKINIKDFLKRSPRKIHGRKTNRKIKPN